MEYTYSKSPMEKYPIYQLGMLLSESPYGPIWVNGYMGIWV